MEIDYDGSLKLLAICVALAAYVSNVRRDMAKRCTSLKEDIKEKLPIQLKEQKIDSPRMEDLVRVKEKKISDIDKSFMIRTTNLISSSPSYHVDVCIHSDTNRVTFIFNSLTAHKQHSISVPISLMNMI